MNTKDVILQMPLRADKWEEKQLIQSFVNVGSLIPSLKGTNNQILYGRRGTGKTHVFSYLKSTIEKENDDCCIFVDLRTLGSTGSIYSDSMIPTEQRAIRLFIDLIQEIRNQIIQYITRDDEKKELFLSDVTPFLDVLLSYLNNKQINGTIKIESSNESENKKDKSSSFSLSESPSFSLTSTTGEAEKHQFNVIEEGTQIYHFDNNAIFQIFKSVLEKIYPKKIWLFIDEFAELSTDLQILLSDMIRRLFCPQKGFIIKIAAIEHRSEFKRQIDSRNYMGIELGADFSSYNLDDFMVFGNNQTQSLSFFRDLLIRHINSMLPDQDQYKNSEVLIRDIFTQEHAFEELVLAAEGVPRDAFNILAKAITSDYYNKISVSGIRKAAKNWYNEDKLSSVTSYPEAQKLLTWIIDNVIGERHARAFLLRNDIEYELINYLYDARILHIIKQNISSRDTPGMKYNVYSIDYGCYVELLNTSQAPLGLFEELSDDGSSEYCEVPKEDYRSIRRAILDMEEFNRVQNN